MTEEDLLAEMTVNTAVKISETVAELTQDVKKDDNGDFKVTGAFNVEDEAAPNAELEDPADEFLDEADFLYKGQVNAEVKTEAEKEAELEDER